MEVTFSWIELLSLLIGSCGLVGFIVGLVTIKASKRKAEGEAHSSIYEGMKVEQDTYQEMINDMKDAYRGQLDYIKVLKTERSELLEERQELRKQIEELKSEMERTRREYEQEKRLVKGAEKRKMRDEMDKQREEIIKNGDKVARLGRIVAAMKPMLCSNGNCKSREQDIISLVSDMSFELENEEKTE